MPDQLKVSVGQYTDKGRKTINQDFHGVYIPKEPLLSNKGIAVALADGISSSDVSQIASQTAVTGFLEDYFCTSEAWSVKKSGHQVLVAANSWLHSQTNHGQYRYDKNRGYVCTFSALVIKSTTAHIFHVGDTRIYRLRNGVLEQLTCDHRLWVAEDKSYLSRALGIDTHIELDYRSLPAEIGDIFFLATDGVYEFTDAKCMIQAVTEHQDDLDTAATVIANEAYELGSTDNLTVQIVRVDKLPGQEVNEIYQHSAGLSFPPALTARMSFDGFQIVRELHASSRSHVYLAVDEESEEPAVIKTLSIDLRDDPAYLERFLMEEWIARRIRSAHVLRPCPQTRKRNFLYVAMEFIEGQTLAQWLIDNPKPKLETVRSIVEQIGKGLRAFHRLEMLHQDIRPNNIMIDRTGTIKIIDFGSTRVAGLTEKTAVNDQNHLLGTVQFTAPEYFLGESGTPGSDIFSLGVLTYHMLSGQLPYGAQVAKARTRAAQKKLKYRSVLDDDLEIPAWVDDALRKAVHPDPFQRYEEVTEFIYDLRYPNPAYLNKTRPALIERNPTVFWKGVSLFLLILNVLLLYLLVK